MQLHFRSRNVHGYAQARRWLPDGGEAAALSNASVCVWAPARRPECAFVAALSNAQLAVHVRLMPPRGSAVPLHETCGNKNMRLQYEISVALRLQMLFSSCLQCIDDLLRHGTQQPVRLPSNSRYSSIRACRLTLSDRNKFTVDRLVWVMTQLHATANITCWQQTPTYKCLLHRTPVAYYELALYMLHL